MSAPKVLIVGGVAAGASAAAKARRCNEESEIILYEKGSDISYATCGLPYYLSGVISKRRSLLITKAAFFQKRFNVQVRTGMQVVAIDRQAKQIIAVDCITGNKTKEAYDKLILATGADPVELDIPGKDLPFVFFLKTLEDTDRIHEYLNHKKVDNAVVIGGGLIGMETAENLTLLGINVSLVEFMPQVLPIFDPEIAEIASLHAEDKGLALCLSEKVLAINGSVDAGTVKTDRERELSADLVIMAIGVNPNVDLARNSGLTLGSAGGISVDEYMMTNDPDIYAAGDCIESRNIVTGKQMIFPMGSAANKQGRAAGANAMGRRIVVKGFAGTVIVKVFDLTMAKTGLSEKEALAEGFSPLVTHVIADHHAGYYPGARDVRIKTIADKETHRLLGAQIIGEEGVDKRIDVMATAIYNKMTAEDLMHLDLAYAPPYSSARDPVFVAGALNQNFFNTDWSPITPEMLNEKIKRAESFSLIDLRVDRELHDTGFIQGAIHIPVDELRGRVKELNHKQEIILYCAVGLRSYLGCRILALNGFKNVKALTGGIMSWTYPLERT